MTIEDGRSRLLRLSPQKAGAQRTITECACSDAAWVFGRSFYWLRPLVTVQTVTETYYPPKQGSDLVWVVCAYYGVFLLAAQAVSAAGGRCG